MYKRTIGYSNVCSSAQDHIIKSRLHSQVIDFETSSSEDFYEDLEDDLKKAQLTFFILKKF